MLKYIIRKICYGFLVLFGVVTVVFFLFNVLPGDPASVILGQRANKDAIEAINRDFGRDKPIFTQYVMYLNDLSPLSVHNENDARSSVYLDTAKYNYTYLFSLDEGMCVVMKTPYFRRSYITRKPVLDIIKETLPETLLLAFTAITLASIFGIGLGVLAALKKDSLFDRLALVLSAMGMSAPAFFMGIIISWFFGYLLSDYTHLNHKGSLFEYDVWEGKTMMLKNLILPALTLGMRPLAVIVQLTRSSLLDVLSLDYIRTARAKGLPNWKVIFKHALKNALNPVITTVSGWLAGLMAGALFVEIVFDWKGIGYEVFEALQKNDLPLVMGTTLIFATCFVLINLIVDIIYSILDPRVRLR